MFLPVNRKDMEARGWQRPDFVLVTGDAYVDHPSFGAAIIARILEAAGYKVCVLAQPAWKDEGDFARFGRPRLGFMITGGNICSALSLSSIFFLLSSVNALIYHNLPASMVSRTKVSCDCSLSSISRSSSSRGCPSRNMR